MEASDAEGQTRLTQTQVAALPFAESRTKLQVMPKGKVNPTFHFGITPRLAQPHMQVPLTHGQGVFYAGWT